MALRVVVGLDLDADGVVVVEGITPALSTKTESVQARPSAMSSCVAAATVDFRRLSMRTAPPSSAVWPGRFDQSMTSLAGPV